MVGYVRDRHGRGLPRGARACRAASLVEAAAIGAMGFRRFIQKERERMTTKTALQPKQALEQLRPFLGASQRKAIREFCRGEEGEWYIRKVEELVRIIERMPLPYMTDGQGDDAVVHLHYFTAEWDFYILEKDARNDQMQAFGLVAGFETELGYINIAEITRAGAEIDLHWMPRTLGDVRAALAHR